MGCWDSTKSAACCGTKRLLLTLTKTRDRRIHPDDPFTRNGGRRDDHGRVAGEMVFADEIARRGRFRSSRVTPASASGRTPVAGDLAGKSTETGVCARRKLFDVAAWYRSSRAGGRHRAASIDAGLISICMIAEDDAVARVLEAAVGSDRFQRRAQQYAGRFRARRRTDLPHA